jgi:hypothetical protein
VSAPGTVTVRCRGAPSHRRQWYGELARLLAAAAPPAAALFEESSDDPTMQVTVRPPEVIDLLRRSLTGASVRVDVVPGRAPGPPPGRWSERLGCVVRTGRERTIPNPVGPPAVDRVGVAPGIEPGRWLGLQTFWLPTRRDALFLARRFRFAAPADSEAEGAFRALGTALAADWSLMVGRPATFRSGRIGARRAWRRGDVRNVPADGWFERAADAAVRALFSLEGAHGSPVERPVETPAIVLGASGAGKTTYLARTAVRMIQEGGSLFAIDLHGDLTPAVVARLTPEARRRVVAIDGSLPPVPGVAALASDAPRDRAAAHLVAALKRLSPDGTDLYWGFRLERIFDTLVRLALETGGSLADLYDLLTSADRRDAARLVTRSVELARFLDELATVVRRNPEFLWSAATRLSKVMLVPALRELLAPPDGGLPVEGLLERGRSVLVRLPFASLGPEASGFAATLLLGRVYLGVAAAAERRGAPVPVSVVLDEVQAFSPRLVAELLTEGRKFGLRTVIATQYPDRLARELENAARGALRGFVAFRVPRPAAAEVGTWLGLRPADAAELLPNLPTGQGLVLDSRSDRVRPTPAEATAVPGDMDAWRNAAEATRREFAVNPGHFEEPFGVDGPTERLLLAVLAGTERGAPLPRDGAATEARRRPGDPADPALLSYRLDTLVRDGYLEERPDGLRLTAAGERRLGLTAPTGATRETAEHRALLIATFRRFAARGYVLEILRQGRFDTTLPDARFRQLPGRDSVPVPADLATEVDRRRPGWAWRFFHGRDVHVEAEVSGALRPERVRHGVEKALRHGAFVLFVVGDAHRARRVRAVLRAMGLGVDRAQVWTLRLPPGTGGGAQETKR